MTELEDNQDVDVLSEEISRDLCIEVINDFVWIENRPGTANNDQSKHLSTATEDSNVSNNNEKRTEEDTAGSDYEMLVEQLYWAQHIHESAKTRISPKDKQRTNLNKLKGIENKRSICRKPSYYKFDKSTTDILEMLVHEQIGPYHNVAGKGQDSVVLHAYCPITAGIHCTNGYAVKVYKLNSDAKKNSLILNRAQREYNHLKVLHCVGLGPSLITKHRNVVVMEFIGENQETAPSITTLPLELSQKIYDMLVSQLETWFKKNIVHGRLSTKNVLYYYGFPRIIGWSHSVSTEHPKALVKLMRDCHFITKFFERRNVPVKSTEDLFENVACVDKISRKVLGVIHKKDLWQKQQLTNPNRCEGDKCRPHRTSRF